MFVLFFEKTSFSYFVSPRGESESESITANMLSGLVDATTLLELCLGGWVVYGLLTALYNVYFHPLRRFPGPLAARASNVWKLYMEVFRQESPAHLLQKLHQHYGMCETGLRGSHMRREANHIR